MEEEWSSGDESSESSLVGAIFVVVSFATFLYIWCNLCGILHHILCILYDFFYICAIFVEKLCGHILKILFSFQLRQYFCCNFCLVAIPAPLEMAAAVHAQLVEQTLVRAASQCQLKWERNRPCWREN